MKALNLARHVRAIRSVPLRAATRRATTLLGDLLRRDGRSSGLVNITLELTYRCNIKCEFCFLKDGLLNQRRDELTLEEIDRLAEEARPFGASFFLTGGEPFLRRDLPEIVGAIRRRGLKVGVNTNGLLVTPAMGRRIRDAGLSYIIFSLHGPKEVHDCLERRKGSFDKVMAHLADFAAHKGRTSVMVNCVVAKESSGRLSEVPDLLAGVPIDGLAFQHETFLTPGEVQNHELVWRSLFPDRPAPMVYQSTGYGDRDFGALEREIDAIRAAEKRKRYSFPIFFKPDLRGERLESWYGKDLEVRGRCLYIWTDMRVEPDGIVNACQVMPTPMGSTRTQPLAELLNNELYRGFRAGNREAGGVFPACARCCKLYRNPVNFAAKAPAWRRWVEQGGP
jgi:MoaA/NifB/PqqE/SkfB family radical SAM enzyme